MECKSSRSRRLKRWSIVVPNSSAHMCSGCLSGVMLRHLSATSGYRLAGLAHRSDAAARSNGVPDRTAPSWLVIGEVSAALLCGRASTSHGSSPRQFPKTHFQPLFRSNCRTSYGLSCWCRRICSTSYDKNKYAESNDRNGFVIKE